MNKIEFEAALNGLVGRGYISKWLRLTEKTRENQEIYYLFLENSKLRILVLSGLKISSLGQNTSVSAGPLVIILIDEAEKWVLERETFYKSKNILSYFESSIKDMYEKSYSGYFKDKGLPIADTSESALIESAIYK